jgi:hypothetical protein
VRGAEAKQAAVAGWDTDGPRGVTAQADVDVAGRDGRLHAGHAASSSGYDPQPDV